MTDQMYAFCQAYIEQGFSGGNRAYRKAYPRCKSDNAARVGATRHLARPNIAAYLAAAQERIADNAEVSVERVLRELARLGYSKLSDFATWGDHGGVRVIPSADLTPAMAACISEIIETRSEKGNVTVKFKLHSKQAALNDLAKYLGMFTRKSPTAGFHDSGYDPSAS